MLSALGTAFGWGFGALFGFIFGIFAAVVAGFTLICVAFGIFILFMIVLERLT